MRTLRCPVRLIFSAVQVFACISFLAIFTQLSRFLEYIDVSHRDPQQSGSTHGKRYFVYTSGCQIPAWDPFDPTVLPLYEPRPYYPCYQNQTFLFARPRGTVEYSKSILRQDYGLDDIRGLCSYRAIRRDSANGGNWAAHKFAFGQVRPMVFDEPIHEEGIVVECEKEGSIFLRQYLPLAPVKSKTKKIQRGKARCRYQMRRKMNVIMVGIDSVSSLNFERHLNRTKSFLRDTLRAVQLQGYTKVADNTFPNLIPLLTGRFISYYWNQSNKQTQLDDLDFIWKEFAACGYMTFYGEDGPLVSMADAGERGFLHSPADYDMRTFWLAAANSSMYRDDNVFCLGPWMEIEIVYDHLVNFIETYVSTVPHFAYAFVSKVIHDELNNAGYADGPIVWLLYRLHRRGLLRNSLLVLFSDHGMRFGPIRQTYIGKFEDRMPIMFLAFPKRFYRRYPRLRKNLEANVKRLTTPFDVHATLQHLATGDPRLPYCTEHGCSLLHEVPRDRTCSSQSILPHWCTCLNMTSVPTTDTLVQKAAVLVVGTVNAWLMPYLDKCARLSVGEVKDARVSVPNDAVLRLSAVPTDPLNTSIVLGKRVSAPMDYMVTLIAKPSKAVLEATVRYDEVRMAFDPPDDVSRLDRYGSQGSCISDPVTRKFCFCSVN